MGRLIGLSGYARSGKDTVAAMMLADNFVRVSFADPMRDALLALDPIVGVRGSSAVCLQSVINEFGWEKYKESEFGSEIRELLQRFGTEVGREQFGENFWVDQAMGYAEFFIANGKNVVFTDVRFPNEARAIQREVFGEVWRVRRPNVFPTNGHISETALDEWDFDEYVDNNGTIEDLFLTVGGLLGSE